MRWSNCRPIVRPTEPTASPTNGGARRMPGGSSGRPGWRRIPDRFARCGSLSKSLHAVPSRWCPPPLPCSSRWNAAPATGIAAWRFTRRNEARHMRTIAVSAPVIKSNFGWTIPVPGANQPGPRLEETLRRHTWQSSSVVEQRTHKPLVGGSNPPSATSSFSRGVQAPEIQSDDGRTLVLECT